MNLYEKIVDREEKISLIGLGYVGMPIAVAFARKAEVIGYDCNAAKIELYQNGIDPTMLRQAKFHIVAPPTPINGDPDRLYSGRPQKVLVDVKALLDKKLFEEAGYLYWRL